MQIPKRVCTPLEIELQRIRNSEEYKAVTPPVKAVFKDEEGRMLFVEKVWGAEAALALARVCEEQLARVIATPMRKSVLTNEQWRERRGELLSIRKFIKSRIGITNSPIPS